MPFRWRMEIPAFRGPHLVRSGHDEGPISEETIQRRERARGPPSPDCGRAAFRRARAVRVSLRRRMLPRGFQERGACSRSGRPGLLRSDALVHVTTYGIFAGHRGQTRGPKRTKRTGGGHNPGWGRRGLLTRFDGVHGGRTGATYCDDGSVIRNASDRILGPRGGSPGRRDMIHGRCASVAALVRVRRGGSKGDSGSSFRSARHGPPDRGGVVAAAVFPQGTGT